MMSHSMLTNIRRTLKGEWLNTRKHLFSSFIGPPEPFRTFVP